MDLVTESMRNREFVKSELAMLKEEIVFDMNTSYPDLYLHCEKYCKY